MLRDEVNIMGFWSRLFQSQRKTYVEQRLEQLTKVHEKSTVFDSSIIFGTIIMTIVSIFNNNKEINSNSHFGNFRDKYHNDRVFFEIGSYLLFQVEMWLQNNESLLKKEIIGDLHTKYVEIFSKSFNEPTEMCKRQLNERIITYSRILANDNDFESFLNHIINRILKNYNTNLSDTVFDDEMFLRVSISAWEVAVIPSIIQTLKIYCKEYRKHKYRRLVSIGIKYSEKYMHSQAIEILSEAITLCPQESEAYMHRGATYQMGTMLSLVNFDSEGRAVVTIGESISEIDVLTEDNQKALNDFSNAIKFNPNNGHAYMYRGGLFAQLSGKNVIYKEFAIRDYKMALKIDPNNFVVEDSLKELEQ